MGTVREISIHTHRNSIYLTLTHTPYSLSFKITIPISLNKKNKESGKITR